MGIWVQLLFQSNVNWLKRYFSQTHNTPALRLMLVRRNHPNCWLDTKTLIPSDSCFNLKLNYFHFWVITIKILFYLYIDTWILPFKLNCWRPPISCESVRLFFHPKPVHKSTQVFFPQSLILTDPFPNQ